MPSIFLRPSSDFLASQCLRHLRGFPPGGSTLFRDGGVGGQRKRFSYAAGQVRRTSVRTTAGGRQVVLEKNRRAMARTTCILMSCSTCGWHVRGPVDQGGCMSGGRREKEPSGQREKTIGRQTLPPTVTRSPHPFLPPAQTV